MADTARSISDLLTTLFQDGQAAGAITPQDMRDLIVSLESAHGSVTLEGNSTETVISVAGTFVACGGTFTAGGTPSSMTETTGGRLTYTGAPDRYFHVTCALSMTAAASNKLIGLGLAKNGTLIGTGINRQVGTGTDQGAAAVVASVTLSTNDYIELYVTNKTDTANVTITEAAMYAVGHI